MVPAHRPWAAQEVGVHAVQTDAAQVGHRGHAQLLAKALPEEGRERQKADRVVEQAKLAPLAPRIAVRAAE